MDAELKGIALGIQASMAEPEALTLLISVIGMLANEDLHIDDEVIGLIRAISPEVRQHLDSEETALMFARLVGDRALKTFLGRTRKAS